MDLVVGPHQHKRNNPRFYTLNTITFTFSKKIILFSLHNMSRELSCRPGCPFMEMFSKETRIAASMNEAGSMPKGMKWSVVCVFDAALTIVIFSTSHSECQYLSPFGSYGVV